MLRQASIRSGTRVELQWGLLLCLHRMPVMLMILQLSKGQHAECFSGGEGNEQAYGASGLMTTRKVAKQLQNRYECAKQK